MNQTGVSGWLLRQSSDQRRPGGAKLVHDADLPTEPLHRMLWRWLRRGRALAPNRQADSPGLVIATSLGEFLLTARIRFVLNGRTIAIDTA